MPGDKTKDSLLDRVDGVLPSIAERAAETEVLRMLPLENVGLLKDTGYTRAKHHRKGLTGGWCEVSRRSGIDPVLLGNHDFLLDDGTDTNKCKIQGSHRYCIFNHNLAELV